MNGEKSHENLFKQVILPFQKLLYVPFELFGIGWEVYLILFILALPIFFGLRWLLSKMTKPLWVKRLLLFGGTIVLTPAIYVAIIAAYFFQVSYYPNRDFEKTAWAEHVDTRYEMAADIIHSNMLIGKTKEEVKWLLGNETRRDADDYWQYDLGVKPTLFNIDDSYLDVVFENDIVVSVSEHRE